MQFTPATFASYGVDGDHDGDVDIHDPADAIFTAARYLCANGAGRDEESTARAVWHYNHGGLVRRPRAQAGRAVRHRHPRAPHQLSRQPAARSRDSVSRWTPYVATSG